MSHFVFRITEDTLGGQRLKSEGDSNEDQAEDTGGSKQRHSLNRGHQFEEVLVLVGPRTGLTSALRWNVRNQGWGVCPNLLRCPRPLT